MGLFSLFSKGAGRYLSEKDNERIVAAVRQAEQRTSGEIRVFFESRCRYVHAVDRAAEIFFGLNMNQTVLRNGVLVYVAFRDHQFAIFADEGIYKEMGAEYWNLEAKKMLSAFSKENHADGIISVINDIGEALHTHFPYDSHIDKNELPDDIVFGK
ncbi:MAG TPA: TPM domain-containing protein [Phnomibacter sp.]|nr:TPM domain-containing protein [Phnomibacter sp.]